MSPTPTVKRLLNLAVAAFAVIALGAGATNVYADNLRIAFVTHANDADSWWNTVKSGNRVAAEQMGVTVEWSNPPNGDLSEMARLIERAAASNPDGLVVSLPDINVLGDAISNAVKKGIPVIIFNSGTHEQVKQLGALLRIGQPEYEAAKAAGARVKAEGGKEFVCVNHDIGNLPVGDRCRGFAEGLGVKLGDRMIDVGMDPTTVKTRVSAYLKTHPETDTILAVGPNGAHPTIQVLEEQHLGGKIHFGTFDLSPQIVEAVRNGTMEFAIDQQPYLQGYLPIVLLANYARYGVIPPNDIDSGPGFVTKENADLVAKLAGEYR